MRAKIRLLIATCVVLLFCNNAVFALSRDDISPSVIQIYVTIQRGNYAIPWQNSRVMHATGTGFVINGKRILTNAHVISDAKFIEVQKHGDTRKFTAKVSVAGHDCDLAILDVDDKSFFEDTRALKFAKNIPELNDEVTVFGYPLGGERISITRGVVSRIDYSGYSHSGADSHLVLQVDAAINPGNSGGPVIFKNKVVGLAFQGYGDAENIGYAIPTPVIDHFLSDVEDGTYNGYPELGIGFFECHNPALRESVSLPDDKTGVIVYYVDPFGSGRECILNSDVILSIDDYSIANDGTVKLDGNNVYFSELVERKQWGEKMRFKIWRNKEEISLDVPLDNPYDPYVYRNIYDEQPEYFVTAGLVFMPLNMEYFKIAYSTSSNMSDIFLHYYSQYAKIDGFYKDRDEFVVLSMRLPHNVNAYMDNFVNGIVTEVNGERIRRLEDIEKALMKNSDGSGFHTMRFAGIDDMLILKANDLTTVNSEISQMYGVRKLKNYGKNRQ